MTTNLTDDLYVGLAVASVADGLEKKADEEAYTQVSICTAQVYRLSTRPGSGDL